MHGMLWGLQAARQAAAAEGAALRAQSKVESVKYEISEIAERIDKLTLVCMAMWSLLEERAGLAEEDLIQRVQDLDLRDGVPDGKVTRTVAHCPNCNRVMSPKHNKCLYCGTKKLQESAFEGV